MKLLKTIIPLLAIIVFATSFVHAQNIQKQPDKIIGIYVHQHWPYNHPYAARTWTLSDWRGYADGMKKLGYNTFLIWPMLETMPNPLTPSDKASLDKIQKVIDMLHNEFGMRVHIIICPNVAADDAGARKATFEKRHFFYTDLRVNPGDPQAVSAMMKWREKLISPLSKADGFVIIDSDPGGYPGSTNEEFVNLLAEHRKIFDKMRPGIELYYWMHAGWPAYCRFYETGDLKWGTPAEFKDAISRLNKINPEPWGLANGLQYAQDLGLESRVVSYNYGAIEGEPSFPFTNFGGSAAYNSGKDSAPRGVIGNAQTHCVQLPNTFAFSRGAKGLPLTESDYVQFADDLIPGKGRLIVDAWKAISGDDTSAMRKVANNLQPLTKVELQTGNLRGLLFGSPKRFINDLIMQLRLKAAFVEFITDSRKDEDIRKSYKEFVRAAEIWQKQHGYECAWYWPGLHETLRNLNSPVINSAFDMKNDGKTPFDRVHIDLQNMETLTSRMIKAMKEAIPEIESREYKKAVSSMVTKDGETHSLKNANWQGDDLTAGGLDAGLSGDSSALCASADNSEGFTQSASMPVNLVNDYSNDENVKLTIGYRRNTLQTFGGTVLWDGKPILTCTPRLDVEKLDTASVTLPGKLFRSGKHTLAIQAMNEQNTSPDFFEVDAIRISRIKTDTNQVAHKFTLKGIYFHDGFTVNPISHAPLYWDAEKWSREVKWLHSLGINAVEFATMYEFNRIPSTEMEKNKIADRLKIMDLAHSLGMKFGYLLSNTTVSTVPDGVNPSDQGNGNAKNLCPLEPGNFEKTLKIQEWYLNTYRNADFFEEFAADWGGCTCGKCGVPEYLRYVKALSERLAVLNPKAKLYADTWCISYWGEDPMNHGWKYMFNREIAGSKAVMDALDTMPSNTQLALPCHHLYRPLAFESYGGREKTPVFPTSDDVQSVKKSGKDVLAWTHFLMDDDPGRPAAWGLVHSEVRYIKDTLLTLRRTGITSVMCNLYLPYLQLSNTYAYARLLDNPDADPSTIIQDFSKIIAHPEDADKLAKVLTWMENNSYWQTQIPANDRIPNLPYTLDKADAKKLASEIRPNPNPSLPIPVTASEWLNDLCRSIDRMDWI